MMNKVVYIRMASGCVRTPQSSQFRWPLPSDHCTGVADRADPGNHYSEWWDPAVDPSVRQTVRLRPVLLL